jgi:hypothetical protein
MSSTISPRWCRAFIVALIVGGSAAASADGTLSGDYGVEGQTLHGRNYTGQVKIASHGKGYAIAWRLDQGDTYRGAALKMDDVLGAVYWSERDTFRGLGVALYRVSGGELQGIWLLAGQDGKATGRENLQGSADLNGDYRITLGENPDGMTNYDGHVQMERHGNTVRLTWYTPGLSAVGNGVRIGDILVVGYASDRVPGTIGYCVGADGLRGLWTYGGEAAAGTEVLKYPAGASPPAGTGADTCRSSQSDAQ